MRQSSDEMNKFYHFFEIKGYVLTAAHCVSGFNKDRITVRFLEHDRSTQGETTTITRKVIVMSNRI